MQLHQLLAISLLAACAAPPATGPHATPPNVVLILCDDAGYADFSFQGSDTIRTPHIDSIADTGVHFAQGYVTASVCSPSRAGLLTGRYQQRFGHEHNFASNSDPSVGLPLAERTLADALRERGYRTAAMGKWHLGYGPELHPRSRGFDEFFGFLQGSRSYWPIKGTPRNRLQRDGEPVEESFTYMTDLLGEEASDFIGRHAERPFFLYLSFNAVHGPMHALEADLAAVSGVADDKRRKLVAMTMALDRAVGRVLEALHENALEQNTLVVFVNDNGGAWNNASSNAPLRGTKGTPFEGGVRVPYLASWPGVLPAGRLFDAPVSTLDIFATALAAAGGSDGDAAHLDGVDLLPYLTGQATGRPHDRLFWRRKQNHAVRLGDWKLVVYKDAPPMLFDLANDREETRDVAAQHPELMDELSAHYANWEREMVPPLWNSSAVDPKPGR